MKKLTIYVDMDGVVADFDKRFEDLSGMKPREFEEKYGKITINLEDGSITKDEKQD